MLKHSINFFWPAEKGNQSRGAAYVMENYFEDLCFMLQCVSDKLTNMCTVYTHLRRTCVYEIHANSCPPAPCYRITCPRQWQDGAHLLTVPQLFHHRSTSNSMPTIRFRCRKEPDGGFQCLDLSDDVNNPCTM